LKAGGFYADIFLDLFDPENGSDMFLRNKFTFKRTTLRHIPKDSTAHDHRKNLKSSINFNMGPLRHFILTSTKKALRVEGTDKREKNK
jgi:hypothetical protein